MVIEEPGQQCDDLDGLTPAELDAFLTCEWGGVGVRPYARVTSRAPDTVGPVRSLKIRFRFCN